DGEFNGCALPEEIEQDLDATATRAGSLYHRHEARGGAVCNLDAVAGLERGERSDDPLLTGAPGDQADHAFRDGSGKPAEGDEATHPGAPDHAVILVEKADANEE